MAKNLIVEDAKPKNLLVNDTTPKNKVVEDTKPKMDLINTQLGNQLYEQVFTPGMYMGIPPFTYAEAGTALSPTNS